MDKEKILKANGIQNIEELNIKDIKSLAVKFSNDFTAKFPCHDISKEVIVNSISKAKMFKADFDDNSYGKYLYENNEIYFNKDINIENPDSTIYHELIHYIQSNFSKNGKLLKMGFFSPKSLFKKEENLGLNEASVQYIASYMKSNEYTYVKYYGLEFATISEKYYPLETTLISQLLFFTGQYSLVNSSILCNNIFKETVSNIISEDNLKQISLNLDKILTSQKDLSSKYNYLANTELEEDDKIHLLNIIKEEKDKLRNLIISTQKIIYENLPKVTEVYDPYIVRLHIPYYNIAYEEGRTPETITYYDSENPNFLKLKETGVQIGMLFDALFTLSPVMYFSEECYEKLIKVPKEELLKRLEGKAKKVLILEKGIYIIFNDKADISYDEFVEMNETFKPLLGLI